MKRFLLVLIGITWVACTSSNKKGPPIFDTVEEEFERSDLNQEVSMDTGRDLVSHDINEAKEDVSPLACKVDSDCVDVNLQTEECQVKACNKTDHICEVQWNKECCLDKDFISTGFENGLDGWIVLDDNNKNDGGNNGDDNNNTDDGDDGDNNNGTVDDGAKKLAEALKAYNDQKAKVDADKEELTKLKAVIEEKKDGVNDTRVDYRKQRSTYQDTKKEYRNLVKAYRVVLKEYRQAKRDYKRENITQEQLDVVKAKLDTAKATYQTYYNDVVMPAYTVLKEFRATTIQPAIDEYKEARADYRTFYTDVYRADRTKLRELKRAYLKLERAQG